MNWYGKPYYSLDAFLKNAFGEKIYKISLDAGMTCPNRDGRIGTRGCIFCSAGGSGDFAVSNHCLKKLKQEIDRTCHVTDEQHEAIKNAISEQIDTGLKKQLAAKHTGNKYIAYFQSFTNTYASIPYLREIFTAALSSPLIVGISIGTRPDCISDEVCTLLTELMKLYHNKFIWIELGLQTMHDKTASYIRRGYSLSCFEACIKKLHQCDIPIIVHVILGLPHESAEMILDTIHYLNTCHIQGIKLQLLHILKGTDLATDYENGSFAALSLPSYIELLIRCLSILSPEIVIHRLTGDGPKKILLAPLWSGNKRCVLNTLHQEMKKRNVKQGDTYESGRNYNL